MSSIADQALSLPPTERLRLIDAIWRSLSAVPDDIPVTEDVLDELERRRERYRKDPSSLRDWEDVKASISQKRGKKN